MTVPSTIDPAAPYRDAGRTVAERVADLIGRMTLPEKLAQLGSAWVFELTDGTALRPGTRDRLADGLGQVTRVGGASNLSPVDCAEAANSIQRVLVEETRLGIPAVVHEEVCAGLMSRGATVFPQPIGLASTWRPHLIEEMAAIVRSEMRAIGAHQGLSPVLDVCRDARWGRMEETFGEDPYLVARMGVAFVRGLQGDDLGTGVVATAKHFVGYGASEGGLNWAPAHIPERELAEVYLHPFEAAVREADLRSIMNGYHELDGVPCAAAGELMNDLLRGQWGFDGYVVSDYFAVRQLEDYHRLATDGSEAAAMALQAGIDIELPSTDCNGAPLAAALESGRVSMDDIDTALTRLLATKFELGLFENPYVDTAAAELTLGAPASRTLASRLATDSLVLLTNDGCLPIDPATTATVAVIGPNAESTRNLFGDYSYAAHIETLLESRDSENTFDMPIPEGIDLEVVPSDGPTVAAALARYLPQAEVVSVRGCEVNSPELGGFDEAVALASRADIAICVVGDRSGLTDDATCGESRDRSSLDLPGVQEDLVAAVAATGTPVVLVLVSGRPCGSPRIHESSAAVLAAWLPGVEGAAAIAEVLTGRAEPGGRLPVSFPRSAGHMPIYYRHKASGGRSHWKGDYVDGPVSPLYPFGHGLTYTSFDVEVGEVSPATAPPDGSVTVTATVANTGERPGDEVVQLYSRDPQASLTRPVLELKAFNRVTLDPGASCRISFTVPVAQLGFRDRKGRYVVEPGDIELFIGRSAADVVAAGSFTITTDGDDAVEVDEVFDGTVEVATVTEEAR